MRTLSKAGRYELLEEIGRGAMGVVYKAFDPVIGRHVAVKTLRLTEEGSGMTRAELITRFQTEARAAGLLTHPNIVVVYDAGEEEGLFYITMELVEGRSLQMLLDSRQSFPLPRMLRVMEQACSALEYAHQRNVVHRDIKPANLMLTPDDALKITDFGTAKILQFGTAQTAHIIGTPSYMSPEQVKGKLVDGRSDIFSLGVILYELVIGEKPFPGQNITTVIYKIVNEDPIPPRELDASVHPGLSYVITRALAKEPSARYPSCREFMDALRNYRGLDVSPEATLAVSSRAASADSTHAAVPAGVAAAVEPVKKRGGIWLAIVLLAVIAAAGYRVWPYVREVWQRSRTPASERAPGAGATANTSANASPAGPATRGGAVALEAQAASGAQPGSADNPSEARLTEKAPEKPVAKTPSPRKAIEHSPSAAAADLKSRVDQRLAAAGLGEKVHIRIAGDTLTLSGRLLPREHRQLLHLLRDAPVSVRLVDHIEYEDEPGQQEKPAAAGRTDQQEPEARAAVGWVFVRTAPPGAEIWVDGAPTGQHTPARVQLPAGQHAVGVSLRGFTPGRRAIMVDEGQTVLVNVTLR